MKIFIILIFICIHFSVYSQQDFDYTLYTRHCVVSNLMKKDSSLEELLLERQIIKQNNVLKIVSLSNTGNTQEYKINFQGFQWGDYFRNKDDKDTSEMFFLYSTPDDLIIEINPIKPLVIMGYSIMERNKFSIFVSKYY